MDLLNGDFAGYKNVEKKNDSVLFGANTADLAIDKRSVENFVKYSADSKDTTFFAVANLHNKNFGKSTMVMLKSPFSGRTYFEVSFRKQKVLRSIVEGWTSRYLYHKDCIETLFKGFLVRKGQLTGTPALKKILKIPKC